MVDSARGNASTLTDRPAAAAVATTFKVLVFRLHGEEYAVDIADAKEVLDLPRITKVPYTPEFVKGAMNLRGEIVTVLDIRRFCGLPPARRSEQAKVIVTDVTGSSVAVLVDEVRGTLDLRSNQIQTSLLTLDENAQRHVKGQVPLEGRILVLLDLQRILQNEAIVRLRTSVRG